MNKIIDFRGKTPKKLGLSWNKDGKYLALSALNVKQGYIDTSVNAHYGDDELYNTWMKNNNLYKGQVLFTTEAPLGNVAQIPDNNKYILSQRTIAFVPNEKIIKDDFLAFTLSTVKIQNRLKQLASGGTAKGISQKSLKKLVIAYPSLREQKKIGVFFTKIDQLIALHERKLALLKQKKQGYLQKLFPQKNAKMPQLRFKGFNDKWQSKKLKELGNILTGNTPSTKYSNFYNDNGTLWVTPSDINSNIITNTQKKLSPEGLKHARVVPVNSLLITCIASIGKNAITYQQVAFNQQINALIPNKNNNPYFLLTSSHFWSQKMQNLTNAGMMAIFNKTDFSNLIIKVPDLKEQYQIGSFFSKLDQLITLQEHKLELLKQKKQAYLQRMFI